MQKRKRKEKDLINLVGVQNTSVLAAENHCLFATNGSPRAWNPPYCQGTVVSDERFVMENWTSAAGGFGLTKDGMFAIGVFNESDFMKLDFDQYLYGFTWLVRKGANQVSTPVWISYRRRKAFCINFFFYNNREEK